MRERRKGSIVGVRRWVALSAVGVGVPSTVVFFERTQHVPSVFRCPREVAQALLLHDAWETSKLSQY